MKLNRSLREKFVDAAMRDVPTIDYVSQGIDAMMKKALCLLPEEVRTLYKAKPEYVAMRNCGNYRQTNSKYVSVQAKVPCGNGEHEKEIGAVGKPFLDLLEAQVKRLDALRSKLCAAAKTCKTSEELVRLLPEFEKYVPTEAAPGSNALVANMATEFMAAGWPKGKAK